MSSFKFVKARWFQHSDHRDIWWIGIHTMEAPEKGTTAEAVANYFATTNTRASAHYNIDSDSIVQSVRDNDVAYAAPGANRHGLHIEHAGYAAQSPAGWDDQYSQDMLALSAKLVADKCREYAIPPIRLSPADLKAGLKGICGHIDFTKAFGGSHTDPGGNFPWDDYLRLIRGHLQPAVDMAVIETGLSALRILYGLPLPPATRDKLNVLRDDIFWPPRT